MPINQPPIDQNMTKATWDLEVTTTVNTLEEKIRSLLKAIEEAQDLAELQTKIQGL